MISVHRSESFVRHVGLLAFLAWRIKDVFHRQNRHNIQNLPFIHSFPHLPQPSSGILCSESADGSIADPTEAAPFLCPVWSAIPTSKPHLSITERRSKAPNRSEQLLHRSFERIARRSLQIVKPQDVLNPHRFQLHSIESSATYLENHAAQIASLDFGNGVFRKSEKRVFRKQSKALRLNDLRTLPSLHFHDPLVPIAATHVTSKRA